MVSLATSYFIIFFLFLVLFIFSDFFGHFFFLTGSTKVWKLVRLRASAKHFFIFTSIFDFSNYIPNLFGEIILIKKFQRLKLIKNFCTDSPLTQSISFLFLIFHPLFFWPFKKRGLKQVEDVMAFPWRQHLFKQNTLVSETLKVSLLFWRIFFNKN